MVFVKMDMAYQIHIIKKSIDEAGSASELARVLGVQRQAIYAWKKGANPLPDKHCIKLAQLYDFVDITKLSDTFDEETLNWFKNKM